MVILVDAELSIAVDDCEVGVSGLGVKGHGEGEEGSTGRGAKLPDRLVAVRIEAAAFVGRNRRVFYPESEPAVRAYGCDEVRVELGMEPLDLYLC